LEDVYALALLNCNIPMHQLSS